MRELRFIVPGPPVAKGRPRFRGMNIGGRVAVHTYTPPTTVEYEQHIARCARAAIEKAAWDATEECAYEVALKVYRAKRVGDLDQHIKVILDGCNKVVWPDDRMVHVIRAERYDTQKNEPRIEVRVTKAD